MHKIGDDTTTAEPVTGEWTEGGPGGSPPATILKSAWLNAVQRELLNVVTDAGLTPSLTSDVQLLAAIKKMFTRATIGTFRQLANPKAVNLRSVAVNPTNRNHFVAVGDADGSDAYCLLSKDAAGSWQERANAKNVALYDICFHSATTVIAVGDADGSDAYLIRSTDGGATWAEIANAKNVRLNAVVSNGTNIVAVGNADGGDAYILRSTDGGASFSEITNPKNLNLNAVAVAGSAFIAAGAPDADTYILRSTDGGATWSEIAVTPAEIALEIAVNGTTVVITGQGGTGPLLLRSTDGGASFTQIAIDSSMDNVFLTTSCVFNGDFVCYGFDAAGAPPYVTTLLYSKDNGLTWITVPAPDLVTKNKMIATDQMILLVGNSTGTEALLQRTDPVPF